MNTEHKASVYFVGAGPGALDLLTLRARRIIEQADLILYADSLVNPDIAILAKPGADVVGSASLALDEIVARMVDAARAGRVVARVHSGDPSIFGAVREQMAALESAGIGYAVVPGVSSLFGGAASLGVELTSPGVSQTVIITRVAGRTSMPERENLRDLASHRATLAIYLSVQMVDDIIAQLIEGGYPPDTPAAVVYRATWPDEQVLCGALSELARAVRASGITRQALILVGEVLSPIRGPGHLEVSRLYGPAFDHSYRGRRPRVEG